MPDNCCCSVFQRITYPVYNGVFVTVFIFIVIIAIPYYGSIGIPIIAPTTRLFFCFTVYGKSIAIFKRIIVNARYAVRYGYACKVAAIKEGFTCNTGNTAVFGNNAGFTTANQSFCRNFYYAIVYAVISCIAAVHINAFKTVIMCERSVFDVFFAACNSYRFQIIVINISYCRSGNSGGFDRTTAERLEAYTCNAVGYCYACKFIAFKKRPIVYLCNFVAENYCFKVSSVKSSFITAATQSKCRFTIHSIPIYGFKIATIHKCAIHFRYAFRYCYTCNTRLFKSTPTDFSYTFGNCYMCYFTAT